MPSPSPRSRYQEPNVEARFVALEEAQKSHAREIESLAQTIADQGRQFYAALDKQSQELTRTVTMQSEDARRQVQEIRTAITELGRPKWNTYIAAGVFCLAIVSGAGGSALAPLYLNTSLLWRRVETQQDAIEDHVRLPGHSQTLARLSLLEGSLSGHEAEARELRRDLRGELADEIARLHASAQQDRDRLERLFDQRLGDKAEVAAARAEALRRQLDRLLLRADLHPGRKTRLAPFPDSGSLE